MRVSNGARIFDVNVAGNVDRHLLDLTSTKDVFWSPRWDAPASHGGHGGCNSYVVIRDERKVILIASINGSGEIRWRISAHNFRYAFECELKYPGAPPWSGDWVENLKVARYFGIVLEEED